MEKIKKKNNFRQRSAPAVFLSAVLLSGCCSVTLQQPEQQRRCGEILAESFCGNDPETFTSPLSGAMKKEFGKSFHVLLNEERIKRACSLLYDTDLPIYQISREVGFSEAKSFCRVFKSIKGCTPSTYAARHKQNGGVKEPT